MNLLFCKFGLINVNIKCPPKVSHVVIFLNENQYKLALSYFRRNVVCSEIAGVQIVENLNSLGDSGFTFVAVVR